MLSPKDVSLVAQAREIIALRQRQDRHDVGCALRTCAGRVFCTVHLEAHVGRVAVCAEAIAIGMGAAVGDTEIDTLVAVDRAGEVVAPCGMCRELISDYAPGANVIVPGPGGPELMPVSQLLPNKYARGGA